MPSRPAVPIPATVAGIESIAAASTSTTRPGVAPVSPFGIMAALGNAPLWTCLGPKKAVLDLPQGGASGLPHAK